jgi:hypothetical protein
MLDRIGRVALPCRVGVPLADLHPRGGAHGNDTTTPATERRFFRTYSDLEPQIRDLTHMAELDRFHAIEALGSNSPHDTEERKHEIGLVLFAVAHVEQMVKDLEKAWDAGFRSGVQSKESASMA